VVLAVLRARRRGAPSITVGAAAALSRTEAARKAIVEAVSDAARLDEQLRQAPEWTAAPGFGNVRAFEDHSRVYADPRPAARARLPDRLQGRPASRRGRGAGVRRPHRPRPGASRTRATTSSPSISPPEDVAELGVRVARIVVPTAVRSTPTTASHRWRAAPVRRPAAHGAPPRRGHPADLHLAPPHPFS